jgi:hypothetical protein
MIEIAGLSGTTIKTAADLTAKTLATLESLVKKAAIGVLGTAAGVSDLKSILGGVFEELEKQSPALKGTTKKLKDAGLISAVTPGTTSAPEPGATPVTPGAGLGGGTMLARVEQRLGVIEGKLDAVDQTVRTDRQVNLNVENHIALGANDVTQLAVRGKLTPGGPTFGRAIADATGNTIG